MGTRKRYGDSATPRFTRTDNPPVFVGKARPKYVDTELNVYDAALGRIRWLFEEFDGKVSVSCSGGKDSTVVVELAAMVAKERGDLPLDVWWLDQETEFQATVDYMRYLMYERDDINLRWYQIPWRLENATDLKGQWLNVWGEGEEWMRPKEPNSIHENTFGEDTWYELLNQINCKTCHPCILDGMRIEESPSRRLSSTSRPMYKWVTWSVTAKDRQDKNAPVKYRFHPIYDWSFRDVWKAIYMNDWKYNRHYDQLFQRGVPVKSMRVSNFHHDQALDSLKWLQELEPETWERATKRLQGISSFGHLQDDQYLKELPYMFNDWPEYMHHLIDTLIPDPDDRPIFRNRFEKFKRKYGKYVSIDSIAVEIINEVVSGDYYGVQAKAFEVNHRQWIRTEGRLWGVA